jgi:hypothetical protein
MRQLPIGIAALLLAAFGCGTNDDTNHDNATSTGESCTGVMPECQSMHYGTCVEIRRAPGHCVDWSTVAATRCARASDCPAALPSGSFGTLTAGSSTALCIAQDGAWSLGSAGDAGAATGYCAAFRTGSDPTGAATCSPDPCGPGGYCSYLRNGMGAAIVECMWPI